jgi:hypothetical protein
MEWNRTEKKVGAVLLGCSLYRMQQRCKEGWKSVGGKKPSLVIINNNNNKRKKKRNEIRRRSGEKGAPHLEKRSHHFLEMQREKIKKIPD